MVWLPLVVLQGLRFHGGLDDGSWHLHALACAVILVMELVKLQPFGPCHALKPEARKPKPTLIEFIEVVVRLVNCIVNCANH